MQGKPSPPPDRLRAVREVAAAQARLAQALAEQLRAQVPWREALRAEARGERQKGRWLDFLVTSRRRAPHAVLADQLAQVQRCGSELSIWADRARAERDAASAERERLESMALRAADSRAAAVARAGEQRRALEALHAELDGLPGRLDPRYAPLEERARALHHAASASLLECDRLAETAERARAAAASSQEVERALELSEEMLRRLERMASQAAGQLQGAVSALGAGAGARELAEALSAAVKGVDPKAARSLARETERILTARDRAPTRR